MKQSLALLFSIFLFVFNAYSQEPCATEYPEEMEVWLKNYKASHPGSHYNKLASDTLYVPVVAHLVGTDAGTGYYRSDYLMSAMCNINEQYANVNMYFYLEDVNYVQSTVLYQHDNGYNSVMQLTKRDDVINMYFVQDPNGACGYFSGWQDIIAINKSCGGIDNSTIAHEIGHYMSLPHTFYGWEGRSESASASSTDERVSGSNCSSAGDYFCDTPADYLSDRWSCPYNKTKLDYNGDQYQVDGELFMSYANDACQTYFSDEQIDAMRFYLQNNSRRQNHLGHIPSSLDPSPKTTLLFPLDTLNYNPPSNYVELKWKSVEGADFYSVMLTQGSNPNFFLYDTITKDTTILLTSSNIQPNFTYRWRVAAFQEGNTCGEYTDFESFSASQAVSFSPVVNITPETCKGFDGSAQVSVSGSGAPFSFEWSNGVQDADLSGLKAGSYLVTVTSTSNDDVVVSVDIPYSGNLDVDFQPYGVGWTSIKANPVGGVGPFTYEWSNSSSNQIVELTSVGDYTVTITDAFGCTASKSYSYTSVNDILNEASLSIFPNPAGSNQIINLEFNAVKNQGISIQLIDVSGKLISSEGRQMLVGENNYKINTDGLSKGVYILSLTGNNVNLNRKVYIY